VSKTFSAHSFIDAVLRGLHCLVGYRCKRQEKNGALGAERVLVVWGVYLLSQMITGILSD